MFTRTPRPASRPRPRPLRLEPLEDRAVPSVSPLLIDPTAPALAADSEVRLASSVGQADYLIVTPDAFYQAVLPLARWKQRMGYPTYVAKLSQVGYTPSALKDFLRDAYLADDVRPHYVLLVGDHENLPAWQVTGHPYHGDDHVWHTDYEYTRLATSNVYPDVALGRLPGQTAAQITTMVDKILAYERAPDASNRFDHALVAGQFQDTHDPANNVYRDYVEDRWFMEDIHRAADFLGGDFDFFAGADPHDQGYTIHTNRVWDSGTAQALHYNAGSYRGRVTVPDPVPAAWINHADESISTTVNAGVGLVLHRDHGWSTGWSDPAFSTWSVNNLSNGGRLPVVFSINCQTNWFDNDDLTQSDCFGEAWLRNPSGGAVAFIGSMRVSYSGENDTFTVGLLDSMWGDYDPNWQSTHYAGSFHLGNVLNYARDRVFSGYGTSGYGLLTARLFNLLGDPSLMLRTEASQHLTVTHPTSVGQGLIANFPVTVKQGGIPVAGARVCLSREGSADYWVGETNAAGRMTFLNVALHQLGDYRLVVTERNADAYEGTVRCVASARPTVSIQAVDAQAREGTENTGEFVIRRDGSFSAPLTVRFSKSGSAMGGSDYTLYPTQAGSWEVTIPAGSGSVRLLLWARADDLDEVTEYAVITLQPDPAYGVVSPGSARVAILNSPSNIEPRTGEPAPVPVELAVPAAPVRVEVAPEAAVVQAGVPLSPPTELPAPVAVPPSASPVRPPAQAPIDAPGEVGRPPVPVIDRLLAELARPSSRRWASLAGLIDLPALLAEERPDIEVLMGATAER